MDFVRQGVMVSLALVLVAQPEARVADLRKRLQKSVEDKHEEVMCRWGGGGGMYSGRAGGEHVGLL